MRRLVLTGLIVLAALAVALLVPEVRSEVRALIRPEPPAPITPLALATVPPRPPTRAPATPTATTPPTARATAAAATSSPATATPSPAPTDTPLPTPTPGPVVVNGRVYDAYIPAASKEGQFYQYSCEFDAAWVILATYGIDASFEEMLAAIGTDNRVEPYIEETSQGFLIHGGDIATSFSGDYTKNFLARSTGAAFRKVFAHYGLEAGPVHDRAGIEAALRRGALVWMKTTVDFKPWRPATWVTPEGATFQTVLGNDHAVVVIGFNQDVVVIRDVLGPTSSNRQRPYEYEVSWEAFLASWGAQAYDGLAVEPPAGG
ncbi:MAG: C39 family peptidase [Chloroflexota bacterium]